MACARVQVRSLACHDGLIGSSSDLVLELLADLPPTEAAAALAAGAAAHGAKLPEQARRSHTQTH